MKTLRRILIVLAAPAALVLGLNQLGGTPLSKGYDTGFIAVPEGSSDPRLNIHNDSGNLNCWLKLKLPVSSPGFSARLSNGTALWAYKVQSDSSSQWIAIVAEGQKIEEQFKWPAGTTVLVASDDRNLASLALSDWEVFLNDKAYDSRERASWRQTLFRLSIGLLAFAFIGGVLEGYAKIKSEPRPLTAQRCIEELIKTTEGIDDKETKWMQTVLAKVLIEGVSAASALDLLPLKNFQKKGLWFKTRDQFRSRLERLINELSIDLGYLQL